MTGWLSSTIYSVTLMWDDRCGE